MEQIPAHSRLTADWQQFDINPPSNQACGVPMRAVAGERETTRAAAAKRSGQAPFLQDMEIVYQSYHIM